MATLKRVIPRIIALLIVGVMINIAIAWAGSMRWTYDRRYDLPVTRGGMYTPSNEWLQYTATHSLLYTDLSWSAGLPDPTMESSRYERTGFKPAPYWAIVPHLEGYQRLGVQAHRTHLTHHEVGCGFPMVALSWWSDGYEQTAPTPVIRLKDHQFTGLTFPYSKPRVLPLRPSIVGFTVNTVTWAASVWLVLLAPFAIGRYRRKQRGQCPACGYPIGVNDVCTECGRPVKRPR